ncbi:MAG: aminotransferase class III-fold pyridoxal phosphate-dependent enzyme [Woeseiaceae bacterium]|nr:aminotransferase class III-fold pyridoxal phosphate-dependent enzyme [Woeseiaceae bacterium]
MGIGGPRLFAGCTRRYSSGHQNARQVDEAGKSYIDFFAGAGVLNFGHNNERMKKALIRFIEADGVAHSLDMYTTVKRDFIAKFAGTILEPRNMKYKMQFTGPTGTNAVEAALKLARRVSRPAKRYRLHARVPRHDAGCAGLHRQFVFRNAAGRAAQYVRHQPFGCEKTCMDCTMGCGLESVERLRALFDDSSSGVEKPAAFLVEAIQAEGGVKVASKEWLQATQKLARDTGALFILDDIQAGCGRTGNYFSFDGMDLDPDIINLAKGIGGFGTPLAMNLVKPEHDKHWAPGEQHRDVPSARACRLPPASRLSVISTTTS